MGLIEETVVDSGGNIGIQYSKIKDNTQVDSYVRLTESIIIDVFGFTENKKNNYYEYLITDLNLVIKKHNGEYELMLDFEKDEALIVNTTNSAYKMELYIKYVCFAFCDMMFNPLNFEIN